MGNRPTLYVLSALLFPLALAGFFVGFACPVWKVYNNNRNDGLWQTCEVVIQNCSYLSFYDFDFVMGTRAVEIAAAGLFFLTTLYLIIENIVSDFQGRILIARLGAGLLSILGGMAGLAGIITYAVKTNESVNNVKYGWALAINAAGSGLAIVLGVGLCLSGAFFEKGKKEKKPYSQSSDYELSAYNNPAMTFDDLTHQPPASAPGYAVYNGHVNYPGSRSSMAGGNPGYGPSMYHSPGISNGESMYNKVPQRHSYVDDGRLLPPGHVYDLSEGYRPSRSRSTSPRPPDYATPIARPAVAVSYPGYLDEPVGRTAFRGDDAGYLRNSRVVHPESRAYSNDDYYRGVRY